MTTLEQLKEFEPDGRVSSTRPPGPSETIHWPTHPSGGPVQTLGHGFTRSSELLILIAGAVLVSIQALPRKPA